MQKIAIAARRLLIVLAVLGIGALIAMNYSFVFARNVKGEVMRVERVTQPSVFGGPVSAAQIYSFAVAVKDFDGEIVTASSEDRQWAVVEKGLCVEARFYPYPPWDLDKSGTYFNARLLKMRECEKSGGTAAVNSSGATDNAPSAPAKEAPSAASSDAPADNSASSSN